MKFWSLNDYIFSTVSATAFSLGSDCVGTIVGPPFT